MFRVLAVSGLVACAPQTSLGDRATPDSGSGSGSSSTGQPLAESSSSSTTTATSTDGTGGDTDSSGSSSETTAGAEPFGVIGFRLADADADLLLGPLSTGDVVDPADYSGAQLSLAADTLPVDVGSVQFFVDDDAIRIENIVPFTLGGNIEFDIRPWELTPGMHTVRAVPYELDNAQGEQGVAREVTFELL